MIIRQVIYADILVQLGTPLSATTRLSTLVRMNATNTSNGIAYMGHRYAMSCAAASVSSASAVTEAGVPEFGVSLISHFLLPLSLFLLLANIGSIGLHSSFYV